MRSIATFACIAQICSAAFNFQSISLDLAASASRILKNGPLATNTLSPVKDMHYAAKLLNSLNISGYQSYCSSHCDGLANAFKQSTASLHMYFAQSAATACGCSGNKFTAKSFIVIDEDLEKDDLVSLCGAALAMKAANKSDNIQDLFPKISALMKSDGTFKNSPAMSSSSTANTRLVLAVISEYVSQWPKTSISEIVDTVMQLLPEGDDNAAVEPTLFASIVRISEKKSALTAARLQLVMENLMNLVHSKDMSIVSDSVDSLIALSAFKSQPVIITLSKNRFTSIDGVILELSARSSIGSSLPIASASIISLKKLGKDNIVFEGDMSQSKIEGGVSVDLSSLGLSPAIYALEVTVTMSGRSKSIHYEEQFTVIGGYEVKDVSIAVGNNKKTVMNDATPVSTQLGLTTMLTGVSSNQDVIYVGFSITAPLASEKAKFIKPHQVFIRYSNIVSGRSYTSSSSWDGKLSGEQGGKYYHMLALAEDATAQGFESGDYRVSILVADFASEALEWTIGAVKLQVFAPVKANQALYVKSLLDASDNTLVAMPEIIHKMRPPAKRAHPILSVIFSALTLLPLVALLMFIGTLKVNLKRFTSISSFLFVGCVVTLLLMYIGYWFGFKGLSFYDTIKWIIILSPVTAIIGRSALSNLALPTTKAI